MAGLRSLGLEFEPLLDIELTPGAVDSAYHPSEVGETRTSALVSKHSSTAVPPQKMMQSAATRLHMIASC